MRLHHPRGVLQEGEGAYAADVNVWKVSVVPWPNRYAKPGAGYRAPSFLLLFLREARTESCAHRLQLVEKIHLHWANLINEQAWDSAAFCPNSDSYQFEICTCFQSHVKQLYELIYEEWKQAGTRMKLKGIGWVWKENCMEDSVILSWIGQSWSKSVFGIILKMWISSDLFFAFLQEPGNRLQDGLSGFSLWCVSSGKTRLTPITRQYSRQSFFISRKCLQHFGRWLSSR